MKCLIVSHDAGGAEIVSAWVRRHPENNYLFVLEGPAKEIFNKKIKNIKNMSRENFKALIKQVDLVLTGTGWGSDLEKVAMKIAKSQEKQCVSFVDHWTNYPERFKDNDKWILPNELWVGDEKALKEAQKTLPKELKLHLEPNPYFEDIKQEIDNLQVKNKKNDFLNILYICEPIYEHAKKKFGDGYYFGVTEKEIMDKFLAALPGKIPSNKPWQLRLRKHPSELPDKNKYLDSLKKCPGLPIEFSSNTSLVEDCAWADCIVGGDSMGLVIGDKVGKEVLTVLPQGKLTFSLPFEGIKSFFQPACRQAREEKLNG